MNSDERLVITESGFLTEFLNQHFQRTDRPFCFILGAGVSRKSGIPTAADLADIWLREMYEAENFEGLTYKEWSTAERLEIPGFDIDHLARFYPQLYDRRYEGHEQAGYAFLENQMEGKEPSYGYSVLAYLLSETQHKVVITTNFDNLVADALSIHSSRFPLVIGHDALAQYAAVELRRPLVAKIHGALGFSPKSHSDEIASLPEGWRVALRRILERYTPIVMGYDGNDGSLMGFLQSLPIDVPDRVLWCVYAPNAMPADCLKRVPPEVLNFVKSRRGHFIPIRGFDELMAKLLYRLGERGSVPDLYERLKERARQREKNYDDQQHELSDAARSALQPKASNISPVMLQEADPELSEAVSGIVESRKEKPWWVWSNDADAAPDDDAKKVIFLQAIQALPNEGNILRDYAFFLEDIDVDQADEYYQRSIAANPNDTLSLSLYGRFLAAKRGDMDKAEEFYKKAIESNSEDDYALTQYATFLEDRRGDMDKAEEFYKKAIESNPKYDYALTEYATFLDDQRGDMDKAEEFYKRAIEFNPEYKYALFRYATFLEDRRVDMDKAEEFYKRAIEVDPEYDPVLFTYATFLEDHRGDMDKAEEFYKRAIEAEPQDRFNLLSYARFLREVRGKTEEADELEQRAQTIENGQA